ncbi:unnamed protein product [Gordionus sp. m RMFG-2023]
MRLCMEQDFEDSSIIFHKSFNCYDHMSNNIISYWQNFDHNLLDDKNKRTLTEEENTNSFELLDIGQDYGTDEYSSCYTIFDENVFEKQTGLRAYLNDSNKWKWSRQKGAVKEIIADNKDYKALEIKLKGKKRMLDKDLILNLRAMIERAEWQKCLNLSLKIKQEFIAKDADKILNLLQLPGYSETSLVKECEQKILGLQKNLYLHLDLLSQCFENLELYGICLDNQGNLVNYEQGDRSKLDHLYKIVKKINKNMDRFYGNCSSFLNFLALDSTRKNDECVI